MPKGSFRSLTFASILVTAVLSLLSAEIASAQEAGHPAEPLVKVSDLIPLDMLRYLDYNAYETDTTGAPIAASESHASTTVSLVNTTYKSTSGVTVILDTTGATTASTGTADVLHYHMTSAGDLQIYGDQSFLELFIPANVASTLTPPNTFVDYLKASLGTKVSYPVATLDQTVTVSGVPVAVHVVTTGMYMGTSAVSVPLGSYPAAHKFDITALVKATTFGGLVTVANFTVVQQVWVAPGVGIVKTNLPSVNGSQFSLVGTERDAIAAGIREKSSVAEKRSDAASILVYPQPASTVLHIIEPTAETRTAEYSLVNAGGETSMIAQGRPGTTDIDLTTLANGAYYLIARRESGTTVTPVFVRH